MGVITGHYLHQENKRKPGIDTMLRWRTEEGWRRSPVHLRTRICPTEEAESAFITEKNNLPFRSPFQTLATPQKPFVGNLESKVHISEAHVHLFKWLRNLLWSSVAPNLFFFESGIYYLRIFCVNIIKFISFILRTVL